MLVYHVYPVGNRIMIKYIFCEYIGMPQLLGKIVSLLRDFAQLAEHGPSKRALQRDIGVPFAELYFLMTSVLLPVM